ncbi:MAG: PAS domain S-box protein [Clostridiales bacterium]|jgi:PAS domain S-box-containing protein|nr:PAS domain S-box protein [Clostridiales bacterium]
MKKNDFIIRLLLLIEFLLIAMLCAVVLRFFPANHTVVCLVFGMSGVFGAYSVMKYGQSRRERRNLTEIILRLDTINMEESEPAVEVDLPGLRPYFDKVEEIRQRQIRTEKDRERILSIVNSVAVNMEIEDLLESLLPELIDVTASNCGAFYLANNSTNRLEIKKSIGFSKNIYSEFDLVIGEGFVGLSAKSQKIKIIKNLPDETEYVIRSFLGKIKPRSVMTVPIVNQERLVGVFTFASVHDYSEDQLGMVNLIKYYVGAAVGNAITFEKTKRLTNELKFQNRLIQNLNDDLEKKVEERTRFLNDILDSINDCAIYAVDKNGAVLVWNKAAESLFGYSASEIVGKHVSNIYPMDSDDAEGVQRKIEKTSLNGQFTENGWRYKKDGTSFYAEISMFGHYDQNGDITSYTNVTRDITTLKNLESDLWFEKEFSSKLIENSTRGLVLADGDGVIKNINSVAEKVLGEDLVTGQSFYNIFEQAQDMRNSVERMNETGASEMWRAKLKNKSKWIDIQASILTSDVDKTLVFHCSESAG